MDPETIRAWAPIIAAIIAGVTKIIVELIRNKKIPNWFVVAIVIIIGGIIGYFVGVSLSRLPFRPGGQDILLLPAKILSQTPTPIPRGGGLLEINFSDSSDGKCNDYEGYDFI